MMSVQITPHNNLISFKVNTLTRPWHFTTILVEPRAAIEGATTKFTTHAIVEVETMVTILGRRAAGTGTDWPIFVGEKVPGSRRLQKSMTGYKRRR